MADKNETPAIGSRDIVFECPSCHKSLVIDEAAEGFTVDCPGCGTKVIVPAKSAATQAAAAEPSSAPVSSGVPVETRLAALGSKLKELQTQRTEISNNVAARLNEINRQMVLLARLESSHQQVLQEWQQLVAQLKAGGSKG